MKTIKLNKIQSRLTPEEIEERFWDSEGRPDSDYAYRRYCLERVGLLKHGEKEVKPKRIFTGGNVEVQNIKVGDIHYEYEHGFFVKVEVLTLPQSDREGRWYWQSRDLKKNNKIDYLVTEGSSHYAPKLYDYEAYMGCTQV